MRTSSQIAVGIAFSLMGGLALTTPIASAAPPGAADDQVQAQALRCASRVPGDVNGDGYAEVAVGEPGNDHGKGAVHVFYGSRTGIVVKKKGTARNDQYFTQSTRGVPGTAERGDRFGAKTLLADLNADGCADLVVGAPGEDKSAGLIQVFFGSRSGIRTTGVQSVRGVTGVGAVLATGDLNRDGFDDLIAGAPMLTVGGKTQAGGVIAFFGSAAGISASRSTVITRETPGIAGNAVAGDRFGVSVAIGDFDGDHKRELAVGAHMGRDGYGPANGDRASVQVIVPTGAGFDGGQVIDANDPSLPGGHPWCGEFAAQLAVGDVHGDGRDDLILGDHSAFCGEDEFGEGAVLMLPGSPSGLTTTGAQFWTSCSPGIDSACGPDAEVTDWEFGSSLVVAPLNNDPMADVAIGAPYGSRPSVTVLLGSPTGLTTAGVGGTKYTQSTPGIPGTDEWRDEFGMTSTAAFQQSKTQASLIVGVPGEDVGKVRDAGSITQLQIQSSGPKAAGSKVFTTKTKGVSGAARSGDSFGAALGSSR